jgi:hypothetical protein
MYVCMYVCTNKQQNTRTTMSDPNHPFSNTTATTTTGGSCTGTDIIMIDADADAAVNTTKIKSEIEKEDAIARQKKKALQYWDDSTSKSNTSSPSRQSVTHLSYDMSSSKRTSFSTKYECGKG